MASKFMVNAAFQVRLLLRPSHQRTVFRAVNTISGRPMLPLILSSRSYSESTPTPPLPKTSGSTESSQSSGPADKTYSTSTSTPPFPKSSGPTKGSQSSGPNWYHPQGWGGAPVVLVLVSLLGYVTKDMWKDWYQTFQRYARESAIYNKLKKGPVFKEEIQHTISRQALVEEIRQFITPADKGRLYPLVIGEHGTGKTSLIKLTVNGIDKPKGVAYVDIPLECDSQDDVIEAMRIGLGWSPNQVFKPASLREILEDFSNVAIEYKQEYRKVPVLIIDNANRLSQTQQKLLNLFQDYAKDAHDKGTVIVVFVTSKGRVPHHMMERSSWSRHGRIIEIGDVRKEEALQYLRNRKINEEQAAQIYELVGGHMIHLKSSADDIEANHTFEDMRETMFSDARRQLESAKILRGRQYHKDGAAIIRELLKKESISYNAYYNLVGADIGDKLLETNIFALHYNSQEITFQSTVMKRYCEKNSADWEGK